MIYPLDVMTAKILDDATDPETGELAIPDEELSKQLTDAAIDFDDQIDRCFGFGETAFPQYGQNNAPGGRSPPHFLQFNYSSPLFSQPKGSRILLLLLYSTAIVSIL